MNDIEQSCVDRYAQEEEFLKTKLNTLPEPPPLPYVENQPPPPPTPNIKTHPLGDDYLAVIELIGDWKLRALKAEKELENFKRNIREKLGV